jgi:hypothetical protein
VSIEDRRAPDYGCGGEVGCRAELVGSDADAEDFECESSLHA